MATSVPQVGADKRGNLLPTSIPGTQKSEFGYLGPDYNYADELMLPGNIGVRRGGSVGAILDAVNGVNYYMDVIAFGGPSSKMTQDLPFQKYGINYFIKTGQRCSNGADMWDYVELIPKGDALGKNFQRGMASIGYNVELKGLAPGIIEDAKAGINPLPLMKPLFGTGYASCKKVTKVVGDELGRIADSEGNSWVDDKQSLIFKGGRYYQTKWVRDKDIDAETWNATPKIYNPDGTPAVESFVTGSSNTKGLELPQLLGIAALLFAANVAAYTYRYTK